MPLSKLGAGDDDIPDSKGLVEDALGFLADALFDLIPRFVVPRQAQNVWPLDDDERNALVKRGKALVNRMSKRNKTELMKRLDKWVPPIALGATAIALVHPRVQMTQEIIAELRRQHNATHTPAQGQNGITTAANAHATPHPNLSIVRDSNEGNGRARTTPLDGQETL